MTDEKKPEGVLVDAAKAIGRTAGKVATLVGAGPAAEPQRKKTVRKPKLAKSNKRRLPRKQKKAQLRAAGKQQR